MRRMLVVGVVVVEWLAMVGVVVVVVGLSVLAVLSDDHVLSFLELTPCGDVGAGGLFPLGTRTR